MTTHAPDCARVIAERQAAIAAWKARWPNHCPACLGMGGFVSRYDPSPSGVSLSPGWMADFEPCSCVAAGRCPRCGMLGLDDEAPRPCAACGWDASKPDGCPGEPECCCWVAEAQEYHP